MQTKVAIKRNGQLKEAFFSNKNTANIASHFPQAEENLSKELLTNSTIKAASSIFLLITLLAYFRILNEIRHTKVAINKLRFNYWCAFKMLYPKHFFW